MARTTLKNYFSSKIFDLVDENEKLTAENANLQQRMDDFLLPKAFICHDRKTALKLALLTADNKHITIDNQKHVEKIKWQNQRIDNLIADNAALTSTINQQGAQLKNDIQIIIEALKKFAELNK